MTVWVVRGGRRGEFEETFLSEGLVGIGFGLHQSVTEFDSPDVLREHLIQDGRTGRAANQLWTFVHEIKDGDMVLLPRKRVAGTVAVGGVSGGYKYRPNSLPPHVRSVIWITTEISRADCEQDIQGYLVRRPTVIKTEASNAELRIDAVVSGRVDGVAVNDPTSWSPVHFDNDESIIDLEEEISTRIITRIRQRFFGTRLEYLVGSILRASGYHAIETRQGPDGGIDVVAGQGDMGFGHPRLCVQAKSGRSAVDIADYNRLQGNIGSYGADHGLLVSLGDYTRAVRNENERSFFQIRPWGPDEPVDRLLETCDELPDDIRSDIPLRDRKILIEMEN